MTAARMKKTCLRVKTLFLRRFVVLREVRGTVRLTRLADVGFRLEEVRFPREEDVLFAISLFRYL